MAYVWIFGIARTSVAMFKELYCNLWPKIVESPHLEDVHPDFYFVVNTQITDMTENSV